MTLLLGCVGLAAATLPACADDACSDDFTYALTGDKAACPGDLSDDLGPDVLPDVRPDVLMDADVFLPDVQDVSPEVPELPPDVPPDVPDVPPDVPDVSADIGSDAGPGCGECGCGRVAVVAGASSATAVAWIVPASGAAAFKAIGEASGADDWLALARGDGSALIATSRFDPAWADSAWQDACIATGGHCMRTFTVGQPASAPLVLDPADTPILATGRGEVLGAIATGGQWIVLATKSADDSATDLHRYDRNSRTSRWTGERITLEEGEDRPYPYYSELVLSPDETSVLFSCRDQVSIGDPSPAAAICRAPVELGAGSVEVVWKPAEVDPSPDAADRLAWATDDAILFGDQDSIWRLPIGVPPPTRLPLGPDPDILTFCALSAECVAVLQRQGQQHTVRVIGSPGGTWQTLRTLPAVPDLSFGSTLTCGFGPL